MVQQTYFDPDFADLFVSTDQGRSPLATFLTFKLILLTFKIFFKLYQLVLSAKLLFNPKMHRSGKIDFSMREVAGVDLP